MSSNPSRRPGTLSFPMRLATMFAACAVALVGIPAASAQAAELPKTAPEVVDNPAEAVTADPLPTAQINGVVWDQAVVGDTVYVVGKFTSTRPHGAAKGQQESQRWNAMSYNVKTGVATEWAPEFNGELFGVEPSPDGKRIYVVGDFNKVGTVYRNNIAAFNTSDGTLISTFRPTVHSRVYTVAAHGDMVYVGGWFSMVNNTPRQKLAAFKASNGALTEWKPTANHNVRGMDVTEDGKRVIIGGHFNQVNGATAKGLASLDAVTGESQPFDAGTRFDRFGSSVAFQSVKIVDGIAYSPMFQEHTGQFEGALAMDPEDGTILNMNSCQGDTYDIHPMNGLMYQVSHHHNCEDSGGFPEQKPTKHIFLDAFTIEPTGTVQRNKHNYVDLSGNPSGSYVTWFPELSYGKATGQGQGGWTVEGNDDYLVVGGEFPTVNGKAQEGLTRFATRAVAENPVKQGPAAANSVTRPIVKVTPSGNVQITYNSNWDRDGINLEWALVRSDLGEAKPLDAQSGRSLFWEKKTFRIQDKTVKPGATYEYRVIAKDADGNRAESPRVKITVPTSMPEVSALAKAVWDDGAEHYWPMDGDGTDVISDNNLLTGRNVSFDNEGALGGDTDRSATYPGAQTNGYSATQTAKQGPQEFGQELWFKTTTKSGGVMLSYGASSSGTSSTHDRKIWMANDGRVSFGVYPGSTKVVTSASSLNDGEWHHVVTGLSDQGMVLYIDGMRVGADPTVTSAQDYSGYWRVGGDTIGGWSPGASSSFFDGAIDEVAVYPHALSLEQVRAHYVAAGRDLDLPVVTDGYGMQVLADEPAFFWRLDDESAERAMDSSGSGDHGTYRGEPEVGVESPVAGEGHTAAAFDGEDDFISSDSPRPAPAQFTLEAWFQTESTTGGTIASFGATKDELSNAHDRKIFMTADGRVHFGVYKDGHHYADAQNAYNDGEWHHAVAQLGPNGMDLYVDGVKVAHNDQTVAEDNNGYWKVGGERAWLGVPYFDGAIDEVAMYPTVLPESRLLAHYEASGAYVAPNQPPVADFEATIEDFALMVDASASMDPDGDVTAYS